MGKYFLLMLLGFGALQVQAQKRNVILIIADDLGKDYCDFYPDHGPATVKLTNVRRLLPQGIIFKNAWSSPLCSPTRAGILTGRHSFRTGVGDVVNGTNPKLDLAENIIPKVLNQFSPNGVSKACIGKWHVTTSAPSGYGYPNTMGFDHYEGCLSGEVGQPGQTIKGYRNWSKVTNGVASTSTNYATTENVSNAISYISAQAEINPTKPFYLHLAFNAPHTPYHLPPTNLLINNTLSGSEEDIFKNPRSYYSAMVEAMDTEIGRLFDYLQTTKKWDNTDIIFIGDNGDDPLVAQSSPAKGSINQAGVSIPFIISGPDVVNPNRTSDALVSTVDLFSTILELFGDSTWKSRNPTTIFDSKSLLPVILNISPSNRDWTFTEVFKANPLPSDGKAIRNADFKFFKYDNGEEKFYNLTLNPTESVNLLSNSLSLTESSSYNYLCTEMSKLVGSGLPCGATNIKPFSIQPNHKIVNSENKFGTVFVSKRAASFSMDGKKIFAAKKVTAVIP